MINQTQSHFVVYHQLLQCWTQLHQNCLLMGQPDAALPPVIHIVSDLLTDLTGTGGTAVGLQNSFGIYM